MVLCIYLFDGPGGIVPDEILGHNHVARLRHREIRLGGYDQAETLQVRSREEIGMIALQETSPKLVARPSGVIAQSTKVRYSEPYCCAGDMWSR